MAWTQTPPNSDGAHWWRGEWLWYPELMYVREGRAHGIGWPVEDSDDVTTMGGEWWDMPPTPPHCEGVLLSLLSKTTPAVWKEAVSSLPKDLQSLIEIRYGNGTELPLTLEETSEILGMSSAALFRLEEIAALGIESHIFPPRLQ